MARKFLGALSLLLALSVHQAAAEDGRAPGATVHHAKRTPLPSFKMGEPYAVVRERLVKSGWQPAATSDADRCEKGDGRCEGRPEMQECAGTADANCNFRWQKAGAIVDVNTIKDEAAVTKISRCRYMCR